jgi:hypothetical protein
MKRLKLEYRKKLLENNDNTCRLAIKKECSEQNIIKLIKTDSSDLCSYEAEIRYILNVNSKIEIIEKRKNKILIGTKKAAIKQPLK